MDPVTAMIAMAGISGLFGGLSSAVSSSEGHKQRKFAAREAEKQRNWLEEMSKTAHQREVADLRAAGLNPILSAGGSGATVSGGASASAPSVPDTSQKVLDAGLAIGNSIISGLTLKKDVELAESQKALNAMQSDKIQAERDYQRALTARQNMENNLYPKMAAEELLKSQQWRHESAQKIERDIERSAREDYQVKRDDYHRRRDRELKEDMFDADLKQRKDEFRFRSGMERRRFSYEKMRDTTDRLERGVTTFYKESNANLRSILNLLPLAGI